MTAEEYQNNLKEFKKIEGFVQSENIKVLNLIMKKQNALDILNGKKKVEFRAYSQHYIKRLYDKKVIDFLSFHKNDKIYNDLEKVCCPLRQVEKIHFHDYNNTWFLDVECVENELTFALKDYADYLYDYYGDDELKKQVEELDAINADRIPMYFYFAVGKILDTNLK